MIYTFRMIRSTARAGRIALGLSRRPALGWILSATVFPALNALLSYAARDRLPFFLDSIFTALAAAVLGPVQGLLVALLTNLGHEAMEGFPWVHLPFSLCGMATALIVGAFVARGKDRSLLERSLCVAAVALANSLLGSAVAVFVYGGATRMNIDNIVAGFSLLTDSILTAAFLARLAINLVDKAIAVLPALMVSAAARRAAGKAAAQAA